MIPDGAGLSPRPAVPPQFFGSCGDPGMEHAFATGQATAGLHEPQTQFDQVTGVADGATRHVARITPVCCHCAQS